MKIMTRVFGITGTNGKTTTACMLKEILEQAGKTCGLIGTIEYQIGGKRHIPVNTTPGRDLLRDLFAEMKEEGVEQCVMEVSSHGIDQGRIDDIRIDYAGFTNLSQDHLDYHKTMENYYQVKKQLVLRCTEGAVINGDDPYGKRLYAELRETVDNSSIKRYSLKDTAADYYGKILEKSLLRSRFQFFESGNLLGELEVSIPGEHFVYNAMLAASMARQVGIEFSHLRAGLLELHVPGRMQQIGSEEDTLGVVDYAHTPDGLEKLLTTLSELKRGRMLCVFGCGGFRDKGKREMMGRIAGSYSDYCIITNDNPRGEPPENIAQAIEEGLRPTGCPYCIVLDRYQAIKRAVSLADKWDIIVVAGKGHETYQLSGDQKLPFDDRKTLRELLEKKYEKTYGESD